MKHARQPGSHRAQAGKRRAERPGKRRAAKPRYGRIAVCAVCATVTGVALLGSLDVLPQGSGAAAARSDLRPAVADEAATPGVDEESTAADVTQVDRSADRAADREAADRKTADRERNRDGRATSAVATTAADTALPPDSGTGYRVVFSEGRQRVWLVDDDGTVVRTYLVSGSVYDNLDPGTYEVFSQSRYAVGIDDSGTMEYFVRFTYGDAGAAIGFHTIPVDDGEPVQTEAQLGTPLSHGCIRQREEDAIALWDFAPVGTKVVVTP